MITTTAQIWILENRINQIIDRVSRSHGDNWTTADMTTEERRLYLNDTEDWYRAVRDR